MNGTHVGKQVLRCETYSDPSPVIYQERQSDPEETLLGDKL